MFVKQRQNKVEITISSFMIFLTNVHDVEKMTWAQRALSFKINFKLNPHVRDVRSWLSDNYNR